jgi:hypothetical protein
MFHTQILLDFLINYEDVRYIYPETGFKLWAKIRKKIAIIFHPWIPSLEPILFKNVLKQFFKCAFYIVVIAIFFCYDPKYHMTKVIRHILVWDKISFIGLAPDLLRCNRARSCVIAKCKKVSRKCLLEKS